MNDYNWGEVTKQKMDHIDNYSVEKISGSVEKELDFIKNPKEFYDFSHRLTKTMVELGLSSEDKSKEENAKFLINAFERNDVYDSSPIAFLNLIIESSLQRNRL